MSDTVWGYEDEREIGLCDCALPELRGHLSLIDPRPPGQSNEAFRAHRIESFHLAFDVLEGKVRT